jgi:hypothetical protein
VQIVSTGVGAVNKHIATHVTALELEAIIRSMFSSIVVPGKPLLAFVHGMTTDGASTPLAAVRALAPGNGWHCICHVVHLLIAVDMGLQKRKTKDGIEGRDDMPDETGLGDALILNGYLRDVKYIVAKIARSPLVTRKYEAKWQDIFSDDKKPLRPIVAVATRWSSTYFLLLRFMEIWPVIVWMPAEDLGLSVLEWSGLKMRIMSSLPTLRQLVVMLEVPFQLTERFSANGLFLLVLETIPTKD